jgi:hypothetical protein
VMEVLWEALVAVMLVVSGIFYPEGNPQIY